MLFRSAACNRDRVNLAHRWIDYCLQPKVSNQISVFTPGTAPLLTNMNPSEILPDIQKNSLILPPKEVLDKSEFIYPLSPTSKLEYDRLWQEVRKPKVSI